MSGVTGVPAVSGVLGVSDVPGIPNVSSVLSVPGVCSVPGGVSGVPVSLVSLMSPVSLVSLVFLVSMVSLMFLVPFVFWCSYSARHQNLSKCKLQAYAFQQNLTNNTTLFVRLIKNSFQKFKMSCGLYL